MTSSQTLNAALRGFAEAGSDGIVQISTGGAEYLSGASVKDMVTGAVALAHFAHVVADRYPVQVALHTDHCPKDKLDGFMRPLVKLSQERVARGEVLLEGRSAGRRVVVIMAALAGAESWNCPVVAGGRVGPESMGAVVPVVSTVPRTWNSHSE